MPEPYRDSAENPIDAAYERGYKARGDAIDISLRKAQRSVTAATVCLFLGLAGSGFGMMKAYRLGCARGQVHEVRVEVPPPACHDMLISYSGQNEYVCPSPGHDVEKFDDNHMLCRCHKSTDPK